MKKQILLTAMLLITAATACAQFNIKIGSGKTFRKDTIDQAVLMVQYEVDGCTDTLSEERFQETMMLEIGKKCSKFYSYTKYVGDSVFAADIANNASQETMIEHAKQFRKSKLNEQTYKRYPVGKVTTLDEIAGDINRLRCEERKSVHSGRCRQTRQPSSRISAKKQNACLRDADGLSGTVRRFPPAKGRGSGSDCPD